MAMLKADAQETRTTDRSRLIAAVRLTRLRWTSTLAVALLAGLLVACGGGGGAKATPTLIPSPTANPVEAYRTRVMTDGKKLQKQMDQLNSDLQSANENQADPKWPQVLTTDFQLVANGAATLGNLQPPSDAYKDFSAQLSTATAKIVEGTQLLGKSISQQDQLLGAQAYAALTLGRSLLDAALTSLPAQ